MSQVQEGLNREELRAEPTHLRGCCCGTHWGSSQGWAPVWSLYISGKSRQSTGGFLWDHGVEGKRSGEFALGISRTSASWMTVSHTEHHSPVQVTYHPHHTAITKLGPITFLDTAQLRAICTGVQTRGSEKTHLCPWHVHFFLFYLLLEAWLKTKVILPVCKARKLWFLDSPWYLS